MASLQDALSHDRQDEMKNAMLTQILEQDARARREDSGVRWGGMDIASNIIYHVIINNYIAQSDYS